MFAFLILLLTVGGCSVGLSGKTNFAFIGPPVYTAVAVDSTPYTKIVPFSVFQGKGGTVSLYEDLSDSVLLSAYEDSKCTKAAAGTFSVVSSNPFALVKGAAGFLGVTYKLVNSKEQALYLGGKLVTSNVSVCSFTSLPVINHFVLGVGYVVTGVPNAAGTSAAPFVNVGLGHRIDTEGRYVVTGTSVNASGGQELGIWRYKTNGVLDADFGTSGFIHSGASAAGATNANEVETMGDMALDASGRLVIVGSSKNAAGGTRLAVWRYKADGSGPDTTFANNGVYTPGAVGLTGQNTAALVDDRALALKIDSNSNLIVAGQSVATNGNTRMLVVRLTSAGVLDSSFATGGVYSSTGAAGGTSDSARALQIDNSGKYVLAGVSACAAPATCTNKVVVWRMNSNGTLDTTFKNTGIVVTTSSLAGGTAANWNDSAYALQLDGTQYVVVGSSKNAVLGTELAWWRFTESGNLDLSFHSFQAGASGAAGATGANENEVGYALAIDSATKTYVVTGSSANASGGQQAATWRFLSSGGKLDTTFDSDGIVTGSSSGLAGTLAAATVSDTMRSIAVDSFGTYTIVGSSKSAVGVYQLAIVRYLTSGELDP